MQRLSVVHLTTFLQGGAGRAIVDLASAQQQAGHEVLVVTSESGEGGYFNYPQYLEELQRAHVPLLITDSLFKRDRTLNLCALAHLLEHRQPDTVDLVHAHAATPARIGQSFAKYADRRVPVVQTQHGWGASKTTQQADDDLATLHDIDHIIVTSEATRRQLVELGVPKERMTTIPCGLKVVAGCRGRDSLPTAARNLASALRAGGRHVVGCIGSVTPNKNQNALLDALNASRRADIVAVFIGEGGEALAARAHSLGVADRVHVLGYQPEAWRWLPLFDALVVPSRTEGQGLVVLEAFRAGVPVVASNIAPLRQLVSEPETGWLFDLDCPAALPDALLRALHAPQCVKNRIVAAAQRLFLRGYTHEAMIAGHDALYRRIAFNADRRTACTPARSPVRATADPRG